MPLLVRNLVLDLNEPEDRLLEAAAQRLRVPISAIRVWSLAQRSIDARKREVHFSYNLELALVDGPIAEQRIVDRLHRPDVSVLAAPNSIDVQPGAEPLRERPIVVGFGPGGMFAALRLARYGYKPIVLERGRDVRRRHRDIMHRYYRLHEFDPVSNLLFGEGGAGTYSDGKLYTRIHDPVCRHVLEVFYQHGADPDILVNSRPHIGSDRLPTLCTRIRETIESLGGEVRFECQMDDIRCTESPVGKPDRSLRAIHVRRGGESPGDEWVTSGPVILAIGHSARDTLRMLSSQGVRIDAKPFQIGVRIEHPQDLVDRWQFGGAAGHARLGAAEYHVVAKGAACEHGDLFSFCMCPGGVILPTNESPGLIATNGASRANRSSPFANSGLVITIDPDKFGMNALQAVDFQEHWERMAFERTGATYRVPAQRAIDFLTDRVSDGKIETSYPLGACSIDVRTVLPDIVVSALKNALPTLDRRMPGFAGEAAIITAPETRASAPVRITRDPVTRESVNLSSLYPVGEGAGYAGGIISAAVDGIRTADAIIANYAPV